jgi:hypothetical protein
MKAMIFIWAPHLGQQSLDHAGLAKGAAQEILDQALDALGVARLQAHALVHAEPGVLKTPPGTWGSAPGRSPA